LIHEMALIFLVVQMRALGWCLPLLGLAIGS